MQKHQFVYLLLVTFFTICLSFYPALADSISINKSHYNFGETITISGKLSYAEGNFVGLQILNPSISDIVVIDQFLPQNDGSFTKSYKAQGPKWNENGVYSIRLVYNEQVFEKQFTFEKHETSLNENLGSKQSNQKSPPSEPKKTNEEIREDPKLRVQGFPDPHKAPNYYFERYSNDKEYQEWFKSQFRDYSISELVGYKTTHIDGFPDNINSPWFYVNRYNTEENYRDWFDSQFPGQTIYEVLGYPESLFQKIPNWIKNNAKWWSSGLISDSEFLAGIEYLIGEKIILIPNTPDPGIPQTKSVPVWIKNTAKWWSEGLIDENEFLKGISFLIENRIIVV